MILPGAYFKMVFDDTKVDMGVSRHGEGGLCFHLVTVVQDELELLLIHGCRGQHSCFHSGPEPLRRDTI